MNKRTAKQDVARTTKNRPPRANVVILSGTIDSIRPLSISCEELGSDFIQIDLDNGLEVSTAARWIDKLRLVAGDTIVIRGDLRTTAYDTFSGGVHRDTWITVDPPPYTGGRGNIRVVKRSGTQFVDYHPLRVSINETVEIGYATYRVEASLNLDNGDYEDLRVFFGAPDGVEVEMTEALEELYLKRHGASRWIIDEIISELDSRRSE